MQGSDCLAKTKEMLILLPAIAAQTYKRLKEQTHFKKITKRIMVKLKRMNDPIARARWAQKQVDQYLESILSDPVVKKHNQCHKGCSACCHTQVSITGDEAQSLAQLVIDGKNIDLSRLHYQAQAKNDSNQWYKLPYSMRGCVFLDSEKNCSIYENRPMVCRSNNVISAPENCSTIEGLEKPVSLINTHDADMAIVGAFKSNQYNGSLPYMLWNAIKMRKMRSEEKKVFNPFKSV